MHHYTNRTRRGSQAPSHALSSAAVIVFCIALLCVSTDALEPHARASAASSGTISSSPFSGPVGTTVVVSGSGWSRPDGAPVYFGYIMDSTCSLVADSQNGTLSGGSFSGWFHWPPGTPKGIYTVCAIIAGSNQKIIAGKFDVLSTSPAQVAVTPGALQENQQATITATNYVPSGTTINFFWTTTGGSVEQSLGSALSNSVGTALLTFTVPITSLASGQYLIEASAGAGQPPTNFSSVTFTYTAAGVQPSPTPSPQASPSPSPAHTPTPTASVTPVSSPTAGTTPTAAPTQPGAGATPTSVAKGGTTPTTSSTTSNGGSSSSNPLSNPLFIVAIVIALAVLLGLLTFVLARRGRQQSRRSTQLVPPGSPGSMRHPAQFAMPGMYQAYPPVQQPAAPTAPPMPAANAVHPSAAALQAPLAYRSLLSPRTPVPARCVATKR